MRATRRPNQWRCSLVVEDHYRKYVPITSLSCYDEDIPIESLKSLPSLVQGLTLHFRGGDVIAELGNFFGGKYLHKNTLERPSHLMNEFAFGFKRQDLPLSLNEKGNSLKRIAPLETLFIIDRVTFL